MLLLGYFGGLEWRDTGEGHGAFLRGLAAASGIRTPMRAELARLDTKMKGRTHLAHKAEHAVDLETGAVVGVTM